MKNNVSVQPIFNVQAKDILSLPDAVGLFNEVAELPLVYEHFNEGCYARAHLICAFLKTKGVEPYKAWEIEDRYNKLKFQRGDEVAEWWYHVAAAIYVQLPSGEIKPVIFDPGFFNGPVSTEQWAKTINGFEGKVQITPYMNCPVGYPGNYKPNVFISTDEQMQLEAMKRLDSFSEYKKSAPREVIESDLLKSEVVSEQTAPMPLNKTQMSAHA